MPLVKSCQKTKGGIVRIVIIWENCSDVVAPDDLTFSGSEAEMGRRAVLRRFVWIIIALHAVQSHNEYPLHGQIS